MFSGLKRLLGNITVDEVNGEIRVEGVDTTVMASHIRQKFATSKLGNYMFTRMDRSSFAFHSFFLPDMIHILEFMMGTRSLKLPYRTLHKIHELLVNETWFKNTLQEPYSKLDYERLNELTLTPLPFQSEFFKAYDKLTGQFGLNGFLLAGAAGSGKTFTSLALTHMLDPDYVIVICPKNALDRVWRQSILGDAKTPSKFKIPPTAWFANDGKPYNGERFIVAHYESLEQARDIARSLEGKNVAVILDESHNLNNDKSLRTERFIQMCIEVDSRDVIWLSGTPIKALAVEAIPLIRCIDPLFNDDVEKRFRKMFSEGKGRALDVLQCRMGLVTFIVEKKELGLKDPIFINMPIQLPHGNQYTLPEVKKAMSAFIAERHSYYQKRRVSDERFYEQCMSLYAETLSNKQALHEYEQYRRNVAAIQRCVGMYKEVKEEIQACNRFELKKIIPALPPAFRTEFKGVRSVIKYVGLKIQGECLGRIVGGLRIRCHVDMVESVDFKAVCESSIKKTVVFTSFVDVIEKMQTWVPKLNLNPVFAYAATNKNVSGIVASFEREVDINPLCATYASLSTAVPLVMADTMILMDSPFRDYILQQAVSRIHRLDSDTQTTVYTVSLDTGDEPNISSRSMDILKWSQSQIEQILGVKSPFEISEDNPEAFGIALEGENADDLARVKSLQPNFLTW